MQGTLQQEVEALFVEARAESFETVPHAYTETVEKEHGRFEKRRYWTTGKLDSVKEKKKWPSLTSVGMVESERTVNGITSNEVRYFISSLPGDNAEKFADPVRSHWSVENNLHWVLDVGFDEDQSRVRKDNAPENMAMLRHVGLNLIKADGLVKKGVQTRRKLAGWDENYLLHLLGIKGAYAPPAPRKRPAKPRT